MEEVFFVCDKCNLPGLEIPLVGANGLYHKSCWASLDFISVEKKDLTVSVSRSVHQIGKIYVKGSKIVMDHPYNLRILNEYRKYPSLKWNPETKKREAQINRIDSRAASFLNEVQINFPEFSWEKDEETKKILSQKLEIKENTEIKKIEKIKQDFNPNINLDSLKVELFGYQKAGIAFLDHANGVALIGDEMGLGKTSMAIGYVAKNNLRAIVVTTASLKFNWLREVEKFSDKRGFVLGSSDDSLYETADFVITNYDQLKKWEKVLSKSKFDCIILDESHYISNISSARTKYVFKIFKNVKRRILLSGTPIKNRPIELYPQLKFIAPEEFSNKSDFGFRYCGPTKGYNGYWEFKGASNLDELNERIKPFYLRRKKADVLSDLPEKRVSNVIFDLSKEERKEYRDLLFGKKVNFLGSTFKEKEASLIELMKFCSIRKIDKVEEFVRAQITEDSLNEKKIIIFAHFRETQEELKKRFNGICVSVSGGDRAEDRQKAVEQFQNNKDVRVFVGSTLAAGTGLNLTAADVVVFADLIWVPSDLKQAEARAHRYGQKNKVFVYYLTFGDTIEDVVWSTLQNKIMVVSESLGDENTPETVEKLFSKVFKDKK